MPTYSRQWNSLSEFVDYAAGPCKAPDHERQSRVISERRTRFTGTETYAGAERLAFNWPEGVEKVEAIRARIALKSQRMRQEVISREVGPGVVDMGRFVAGHPQPYMVLRDSENARPGKGRIVRVVMNCSVSSKVSHEVIETRGAAVLALCAALEQSGRRVEIVVTNSSFYRTHGKDPVHMYDYAVTIKGAERRLNLNSVVFAMVHPSFLRRFIFSVKELEHPKGNCPKAYPCDPENLPADALYISGAHIQAGHFDTVDAAAAWINDTLAGQGVKTR